MGVTRQSLVLRAQTGDEGAWRDLTLVYRPWITGLLTHQSIPRHEADDLVQEILLGVVQSLPRFEHSGRRGAFRAWLRTIARNSLADYWKAKARAARNNGRPADPEAIDRVEDPEARMDRLWDEEHDRYVLRCLLDILDLEFEPSTVKAFRLVALEGRSNCDAASELGLSVGAVYAAKSRVLRRLRAEAHGLIDEFS